MASVAVIESNGNKNAVNTKHGYRSRALGAYQVRPRFHGKVPSDAFGQTMQAQAILEELVETKDIISSLNYYNGQKDLKRGKYAYKVSCKANKARGVFACEKCPGLGQKLK